MRTLLYATGLSVLILSVLICDPAGAGRNANGAMLLHTNDAVQWTTSPLFDPCSDSAPSAPLPATCDELNTTTDIDPNVIEAVVWMVGAFGDNSSPAVTAYQVGLYGTVFNADISAHAACGTVLELPDTGWPGPGTGTAVTYTSGVVRSQLFKMYWFAAAPAAGIGAILATGDYYGQDHHAEWVDDSTPPLVDYCTLFGSVGWGVPGSKNCPTAPQTGACCFCDGSCQDLTSADCGAAGGVWEGMGTSCATSNCAMPPAACCFPDGSCQDYCLTQDQCTAQGGTYFPGESCANISCPPPIKACCFPDYSCQNLTPSQCTAQGGVFHPEGTCDAVQCGQPPTGGCCKCMNCEIETEDQCIQAGGRYLGDGSGCDPAPCLPEPGACCLPDGRCVWVPKCACDNGDWEEGMCDPNNPCQPTPTKATTWGRIKEGYR